MTLSPQSLFSKIFSSDNPKDALIPLYQQVVEHGRNPHWYLNGGVKDTQDGRFDMIVAILSIVLLRLESNPDTIQDSVFLTEIFVDDMDGQMREMGMGDVVVGKHVGNMVGALGGRLAAYREAYKSRDIDEALVRNLYRGDAPSDDALAIVSNGLLGIYDNVQHANQKPLLMGEVTW